MKQDRLLYSYIRPHNGCDFHRIICPFRWTAEEPEFQEWDFDLSVNDPVHNYKYYLGHGTYPLSVFPELAKWKRSGSEVVLSIDDDYEAVPEWSPAKCSEQQLDLYYLNLEIADKIIVSTKQLVDVLGRPQKTLFAPNLIQVDDYVTNTPANFNPREPMRILWAGSTTHSGDLELVVDAVDRILQKHKYPKVEFIFVGYAPDKLLKKYLGKGVHFELGVKLNLYHKVLHQIRPHITLAPLANIPFNLSKSNIRILEGWALTSAVVASPVGEYRKVNSGFDGLIATDTDSWFDCLDSLITQHEYRNYLAVNGRKRVATEFSWENPDCRSEWRELIRSLVKNV